MTELLGRVIEGYRVEAEIGRGGQAVVYRATQLSLQRTVALKVVSRTLSADPTFLERFTREGIAAASLDHPHVIPVFEAGEADGVAFLAMKFVDGPSLDALIRAPEGLEARRSLAILRQIAEALDYVSSRGMVHRDVKPANILLGPGDHAYLSDFGLIKAISATRLTGSGVWMGTFEYVAPEQIRGVEVTPAADRYALAAVAYEALTGTTVFPREDRTATLYAHVNDPPAPASGRLPALGAPIDAALARGLAKDPADRPPTAVALIDDLERALAATPGAAGARPARRHAQPPPGPTLTGDAPAAAAPPPPPSPAPPPPPPPPPPAATGPRWRVPAIVAAVLAALAAVIAVTLVAAGGGEDTTVTTFVLDTEGVPTAPPGPPAAFPLGAVLPAAVPGWQVTGTDPGAVNLELDGRGAVETAEASRGADVALLVGLRPDGGEDARVAVERLRAEIGGVSEGGVPLGGVAGDGAVQRAGGAFLVTLAVPDRAVVAIAAERQAAVELAAAVSEAL